VLRDRINHTNHGPRAFRAKLAPSAVLAACALLFACSGSTAPAAKLTLPTALSAGSFSACVVVHGGRAACWGQNDAGVLGTGLTAGPASCRETDLETRRRVTHYCSFRARLVIGVRGARDISVGQYNACAVIARGSVECWGLSMRAGNGGINPSGRSACRVPLVTHAERCDATPRPVPRLHGAVRVGVGANYACALLATGTVQCWGDNTEGQLGDGTTARSSVPRAVKGLSGVTQVSTGFSGACAIARGHVECWGGNGVGELGGGVRPGPERCSFIDCSKRPVTVRGITNAVAVTRGGGNACAVLATRQVECWGWNQEGELGQGGFTGPEDCTGTPCSASPVVVKGIAATAVTVGETHSCALTTEAQIVCWGGDLAGELGRGNVNARNCAASVCAVPQAVGGLSRVSQVGAGANYTCAVTRGRVYCWGSDRLGQLGARTITPSGTCAEGQPHEACTATPVRVGGL
jgi:alpha-tubulin suppressor-like RCC1 family protein